MSKEKIEVGDYVKHGNGTIGKIIEIDDNDNDYTVIDDVSDQDYWSQSLVEFVDPEEAEKKFIFIEDISQDYHGAINFEERHLRVGCQKISFETIEKIYSHIKHTLPV